MWDFRCLEPVSAVKGHVIHPMGWMPSAFRLRTTLSKMGVHPAKSTEAKHQEYQAPDQADCGNL